MTSIEGVALNGSHIPNGRVVRTVPTFARPRIDLDASGNPVRRQWRPIAVRRVQPGDNIPGIGQITDVTETIDVPPAGTLTAAEVIDATVWTVTVLGPDGTPHVYHGGDEVYAFTAAS